MIYLNTDFATVIYAFSCLLKDECNATEVIDDFDELIVLWDNYTWEKIPTIEEEDIRMMAEKLIEYEYQYCDFYKIDYTKEIKIRFEEDNTVIFESED